MPLETDISSQKCRSASLQCIIKSICYFITCRQMTNKMSSFFHPFLFDWHRTASAEFVVVSHWSFVFVLKMAQSLKRQKPTERKLNYFPYFFLFCFAIRWRAVVTLFFFRVPPSVAVVSCRCCCCTNDYTESLATIFSALFEWEILHFYCRRINYLVSFLLCHSFYSPPSPCSTDTRQSLYGICFSYCGFRSRFFLIQSYNLTT